MHFTQALRILADHVHVAEDIREQLHDAIDAEASLRGEPAGAKVAADAAQAATDREVAELQARLAELTGGAANTEGA